MAADREKGLKPVIGVPALTLSIITGMIGAGIFVLPATVGLALGASGIWAYLICSILVGTIMLCYAEIGSRITTSGGSYAYVEAAFGSLAGYLVNWLYFFGWSLIGSAALLNVVADTLAILFPLFKDPVARYSLFFILTILMIGVNVSGAKESVAVVKLITVLKLLPLFGIIILGFGHIHKVNLHATDWPVPKAFADTTLMLFFAFAGFEMALGASGEIKNPKRTVPLGICLGGVLVLVIYILLQIIVQGVLGTAMASYKDAPLAAVADQIVGPAGSTVLLFCAALSCFGNVTLDILCTPRILFAGAKNKLFPQFLGKLHPKFATPYLAVITYGLLILVFSIAGGFQQLAVMASVIILLVYLGVILAMIKLRLSEQRPGAGYFKAPGGWATPAVAVMTICWLLSSLSAKEFLWTFLFILVIICIYLFQQRLNGRR